MNNNVEGYSILLKIEINLREYLIVKINLDTGIDLFTDILLPHEKEDINRFKKNLLSRKKEEGQNYNPDKLWHPFYYLDFKFFSEIFLRNNTKIMSFFENLNISKKKRNLIASEIVIINPIRNDIAHSKLITDNDLNILKSSYSKIESIIPEISNNITTQSIESNLGKKKLSCKNDLQLFLTEKSQKSCILLIESIQKLNDSFWIKYLYPKLNTLLSSLILELKEIESRYGKTKFLYYRNKWMIEHEELLNIVKSELKEK